MLCSLTFLDSTLTKKSSPAPELAAEAEPLSFHEFIDALPGEPAPVAPESPKLRIPEEAGGIQINFCKNPACVNFGIPAEQQATRGPGSANRYTIGASGAQVPQMRCNHCNEWFPVKSNQGILEEVERMGAQLGGKDDPCCPNEACANHEIPVGFGKLFYSAFGKTAIGSPRWKCKACGKTFSAPKKSTHRQRESHKNREVFAMLAAHMPLRRIIEITGINPRSIYTKIDFIHRQCVAFAAAREARLPSMAFDRMRVSVDRQTYAINWTRREDRRNVVLSAVASADNDSGYVFGAHLNFDPAMDAEEAEWENYQLGDLAKPQPFRRHARLWLEDDYQRARRASKRPAVGGNLDADIQAMYAEAGGRDDIESLDAPTKDEKLPERGMQTHLEYTLYGHFFHLAKLFEGVEKVRFFLDQDSGMRAACLGAFAPRVKARTMDALYVRLAKEMHIDRKRALARESKKALSEVMAQNPGMDQAEAVHQLMVQATRQARQFGRWQDRWMRHPISTLNEPEKAFCLLTDVGDLDEDHLARLCLRASLHGVDSFFNQVRRRVGPLERGIHSQGNAGRVWNGYAPYDPSQAQKLLDIFRVIRNYILVSEKDKQTPAMRIGLARGPVKYEDVLYFT